MAKPLAGVRVVELATFVAGPSCARLLADMGAEVIKLEPPKGDTWRATGVNYLPTEFSVDENPIFDIYNTGKKFLSLNLKTEEGKEAFMKLMETTDVFVTNNRPAALKRLGIYYDDLKDRFPKLVYAVLLGYGEKGPDAHRPAFDSVGFWSKSGFLHDQATKREDYAPISPPWGVGDTVTGYLLLAEICAALYRRKECGEGDYVTSGLYHNGIFAMGTMNIQCQRPFGKKFPVNRVDHGVPGGVYQCADGEWVYVGISSNAVMIPLLCKAIGRADLLEDRNYMTENLVVVDRPAFYQIFKDAFLSQPHTYWLEKAEEFDIPLVRMNSYADVYEDEQAWANHYVEKVTFRNGKTACMPTSPIEMGSVGELKTVPAEGIGAHTAEILAGLGYTQAQIEAMIAAGAAK